MSLGYATVLQLTDLHLFAEADGLFNGINTRVSYQQVLAHVQQHYGQPDVIVLTGDLAHDGKPETYQYIADSLACFDRPVCYVLGNHDHRQNAEKVYPTGPIVTGNRHQLSNWQLILLDSNHQPEPDSYQGEVSSASLQGFETAMRQQPDLWALVAMHHNLPVHEDRGVTLEVRNQQQVMASFSRYPKLKAVISGHVHQEFTIVQDNICYLSTPTTGYQSKTKTGHPTGEAPGYRWLKLYNNGGFETDVRRISYRVS